MTVRKPPKGTWKRFFVEVSAGVMVAFCFGTAFSLLFMAAVSVKASLK